MARQSFAIDEQLLGRLLRCHWDVSEFAGAQTSPGAPFARAAIFSFRTRG
jgi:hypothetical protein